MDAGRVERGAVNASMIDHPYRLEFEWAMSEPSLRLRGRGVVRLEPPFRARIDLFTSNGERVAAAALIGDEMRGAPGLASILPPPALFWASLGVVRAGGDAALMRALGRDNDLTELLYRVPPGELRYTLRGTELVDLALLTGGSVGEEVRLRRAAGERFPREAIYRHLGETRELRLTLQVVEQVEAYPSAVWNPEE